MSETTTEPNYAAEMKLPDGRTCDDCRHSRRCFAFGFAKSGNASCDFWPNLFALPSPPAAQRDMEAGR